LEIILKSEHASNYGNLSLFVEICLTKIRREQSQYHRLSSWYVGIWHCMVWCNMEHICACHLPH